MPESFFCRPMVCNFIKKEALAQVFSRDFCEISKNTFFYKTRTVAASVFWICLLLSAFSMILRFQITFIRTFYNGEIGKLDLN